ncbi:CidA/LrgA family protein [Aestuariirhabdus sp. Z084]|nr:CidA/LrgA family protein [Aestuariirhabdus haliotis]MCL6420654.1 CidA/LrgA family protein [Aestuariirhabdus haliotis]
MLGMCLLLVALLLRGRVDAPLETAATGLLSHLSLLFVPAGGGLMVHVDRLGTEWLPILVALVLSTLIAMAVTGMVMQWAMKWSGKKEQESNG